MITTIFHPLRSFLNLNCVEYLILDLIHECKLNKLSTPSEINTFISKYVGIEEEVAEKIINNLLASSLIELDGNYDADDDDFEAGNFYYTTSFYEEAKQTVEKNLETHFKEQLNK